MPIASPSGTPMAIANTNPATSSVALACRCGQITPFVVSLIAASTISVGELSTTFLMIPSREAVSQSVRMTTKPMSPNTRRSDGRHLSREGRTGCALRATDWVDMSLGGRDVGSKLWRDQLPDPLREDRELRRALDAELARSRKVNGDVGKQPL